MWPRALWPWVVQLQGSAWLLPSKWPSGSLLRTRRHRLIGLPSQMMTVARGTPRQQVEGGAAQRRLSRRFTRLREET
jgi:hypothetical protein